MSRARDTADQINRVNSSAADATAITVDSSENVGIGTSSSLTNLSVAGAESGVLSRVNVDVADSQNRTLTLSEQKITFAAPNTYGTNYNAFINYGLTSLQFGSGNTERIRIDSDGLKFNGDTAAANALNDYEEGTWTPVDGSGQVTITGATGVYTRVGRQVTVIGAFTYPSTSQTNYAIIAGLPFSVSNYSDAVYASGSVQTSYISSTNRHLAPLAYKNTSTFYFYDSELPLTNAAFSTRNFRINITYFTDQ